MLSPVCRRGDAAVGCSTNRHAPFCSQLLVLFARSGEWPHTMSNICLPLWKLNYSAVLENDVVGHKQSAQPERSVGLANLSSPAQAWRSLRVMTSLKEERACHQSRFPHLQELTEHPIFNASVGSRALSDVGQQLSSSATYPITARSAPREPEQSAWNR